MHDSKTTYTETGLFIWQPFEHDVFMFSKFTR
jgi:hypothetical protein